jgi:integrase
MMVHLVEHYGLRGLKFEKSTGSAPANIRCGAADPHLPAVRVPLHPVLVRAQFLTFVEAARKSKRVMLFDGLPRGGPDKRFSHFWSRWFTGYRRAIGAYAKDVYFHAFRHSFTTALEEAGVSRAVIDQIDWT